MHVVISGYYGFKNVGDEAILFSIIEAMRNFKSDIEITVLSNHPELTAEAYEVHAVDRWKFKEVNHAIKQADGLISGGGSLLQDKTGLKSIPYYAGVIALAHWHKKPTFIYAQGMGPINKWISQCITKKVLNKVNRITVRDTHSQALLKEIGVKQDTQIVPDPVFGISGQSYTNTWTKAQSFNNEFISVSMRDWPTEEPYLQKMATCLDKLVQQGYEIVFVSMHDVYDDKTSRKTAALMTEKSYLAPKNLSIQEKISIIGESKLLIGIRLHALIFAAMNYTPFVALSYDPKIDAFAEICEQPLVGHIAKDNWTSEDLYEEVNHTLTNFTNKQDEIKSKVTTLKEQALEVPKLVVDTFNHKKV